MRDTHSLELVLCSLTKVLGTSLEVGTSLLGLLGSSLLVAGCMLDRVKDLFGEQSSQSTTLMRNLRLRRLKELILCWVRRVVRRRRS